MSLLKFELSKHLPRINLILIAVMLMLSLSVTFIQYSEYIGSDAAATKQAKADLIDEYNTDRASYEADYADYLQREKIYRSASFGAAFDNKFIDTENYGDRQLFTEVNELITRSENYQSDIGKVLSKAYSKVIETGIMRGNYVYEYQAELIIHYTPTSELVIPVENYCGWEEFFTLKTPVIFLALTCMTVFAGVYLIEKRTKTISLLAVTKRGGLPLVLSKLSATAVVSTVLTLLFTLTPLAVFAVTTGLSNPMRYIQSIAGFELCPYVLTIWQYLLLFVLVRLAVFLAFSLFVMLLGQLFSSELTAFPVALVILIVSYLLSLVSVTSPLFDIRRFNFFDIAFVTILFDRYRALNFFGMLVGYIPAAAVIVAVIIAVIVTTSFAVKLKKSSYRMIKIRRKPRVIIADKKPIKDGSLSLLRYEFHKFLLNKGGICLLIGAIAVKAVISGIYYAPDNSMLEQIKQNYIADLQGELNADTADYLRAEREYINTSVSEYKTAQNNYKNGDITLDELDAYAQRNNYANTVETAFSQIETWYRYLTEIAESYDNIEFVYEAGVEKYLTPSLDFVLILLIIALFCNVFSKEYDSGFIAILGLTKRGGAPTFRAKYQFALITASALFAVFFSIDTVCLVVNYGMDYLHAGIMSIPTFESTQMNVSILSYFLLYKTVSYAAILALSALIVSISAVAKKLPVSIITSVGIVFIPFALTVFGVDALSFLDVSLFTSPMLVDDCIIPAAVYMTAAAALTVTARFGFVKK